MLYMGPFSTSVFAFVKKFHKQCTIFRDASWDELALSFIEAQKGYIMKVKVATSRQLWGGASSAIMFRWQRICLEADYHSRLVHIKHTVPFLQRHCLEALANEKFPFQLKAPVIMVADEDWCETYITFTGKLIKEIKSGTRTLPRPAKLTQPGNSQQAIQRPIIKIRQNVPPV